VQGQPLLVEAGYGCSRLVASNGFVRTNLTFTCRNKNDAPHECGNPKCKGIALGWLLDERFPRDHRHQPAASLANRTAGARKLLASVANAELHQLACVVPGDAPS